MIGKDMHQNVILLRFVLRPNFVVECILLWQAMSCCDFTPEMSNSGQKNCFEIKKLVFY